MVTSAGTVYGAFRPPLAERARTAPDAPALAWSDGAWTYGALYRAAHAIATTLDTEYGIRRGSRVATILGNSSPHAALLHACMLAGATAVPINPRFSRGERATCIALAAANLVIAEDAESAGGFGAPCVDRVTLQAWIDAADHAGGSVPDAGERMPDEIATILFTSGSSGVPKAVPLTYANHRASAAASAANLGEEPGDAWLCALPFCHAGGYAILFRAVLAGARVVVLPGFDPAAVRVALEACTLASFVPTQFARLLATDAHLSRAALPRLRAVLLGGGPAPEALLAEAETRGLPVLPTYGLTEAASQVCTVPPSAPPEKRRSAGRPLPGMTVTIRDDGGRECAPLAVGEIHVRGAAVFSGYLGRDRNAETFTDAGFRTGDLGYVDDDGYLAVVMRRGDRIVTGGENVAPAEVEDVLRAHPAVSDAIVAGIEDAEWGQAVAALVVPAAPVDAAALSAFCRGRLAGFKIPRRWRFVDALPTGSTGKVDRAAARTLLAEGASERTE